MKIVERQYLINSSNSRIVALTTVFVLGSFCLLPFVFSAELGLNMFFGALTFAGCIGLFVAALAEFDWGEMMLSVVMIVLAIIISFGFIIGNIFLCIVAFALSIPSMRKELFQGNLRRSELKVVLVIVVGLYSLLDLLLGLTGIL